MSIQSKERTVIAAATLFSSLVFYHYAKKQGKSEVPYVMVGAFMGTIAAEIVLLTIFKSETK